MNERFVSIKVDREERPDLDGIYMDAVQAMTGQGGWPMSAFLTPDGRAVLRGHLLPARAAPRHAVVPPGAARASPRRGATGATRSWRRRASVTDAIGRAGRLAAVERAARRTRSPTRRWRRCARRSTRAGAGSAARPKFPQPMTLEFLLRQAVRGDARRAGDGDDHPRSHGRRAASTTRSAAASPGTRPTARWHVPHFEKMLYDNAQLVQLYTRAWLVTGARPLPRRGRSRPLDVPAARDAAARGRVLLVPGRGHRGRRGQVLHVVVGRAGRPGRRGRSPSCFGATPGGQLGGGTHERAVAPGRDLEPSRRERASSPTSSRPGREDARRCCSRRARHACIPATDDKVLDGVERAWRSGRSPRPGARSASRAYVEAAVRCADVRAGRTCATSDGRLLRSWRDGVAGRPGLRRRPRAAGVGVPHPVRDDVRARVVRRHARDARRRAASACSTTRSAAASSRRASTPKPLVVRPKELYDNAVPSGNSARPSVLLRLCAAHRRRALRARGDVGAAAGPRRRWAGRPTGFGHALCALDLYLGPDARGRDRRRPRRRPRPGRADDAVTVATGSCRTRCSPSPDPTTPAPTRDRAAAARTATPWTACPPPTSANASSCHLPVTRHELAASSRHAVPSDVKRRRGSISLAHEPDPCCSQATRRPRSRCAIRRAATSRSPTSRDATCSSTSIRRPTRPAARPSPARSATRARTSRPWAWTSSASHRTNPARRSAFDEKFALGFPLLSDPDHAVADAWGVWGEKSHLRQDLRWGSSARRSWWTRRPDPRCLVQGLAQGTVPNALKALECGA